MAWQVVVWPQQHQRQSARLALYSQLDLFESSADPRVDPRVLPGSQSGLGLPLEK